MDSDKEKPIIGNSLKQQHFKMEISTLPLAFNANKKAWMTSGVLEISLNKFNTKMKKEMSAFSWLNTYSLGA
jgi:hypothetical protein